MELSKLLEPDFIKRAAVCMGLGFLLCAAAWRLGGNRRGALTLAALGGAWIGSHLFLSILTGVFPPKEPVDWLVPGSGLLVLVGAGFSFRGRHLRLMAVAAGLLMALTFWQVLRHMPYLLSAAELPAVRQQWTLAAVAAVVLIFAAAEWLARGQPALAVTCSMAIFAAAAVLGLWKLGSPGKMLFLPAAVAAMLSGAGIAALALRRSAVIPPGWAGWCAGGIFVIYIRFALSRASSVPMEPMLAAAAAIPAAAIFTALWRRTGLGGNGFAAVASVLLAGAGIFWYASADQRRMQQVPPAPAATGADDTGAYDGL